MKTKEIELKCTMPPHELQLLETWLLKNGSFISQEWLCDYYFDDEQGNLYRNDKVLRVRHTPTKYVLCYKQWHRDKTSGNRTYADEYEVVVSDGHKAMQLLSSLGYQVAVIVEKERKTYSAQGFEIALDNVKGLGAFVEIELDHDVEDVEAGIASIYDLLNSIGIQRYQVQCRGYSAMIRAQQKK